MQKPHKHHPTIPETMSEKSPKGDSSVSFIRSQLIFSEQALPLLLKMHHIHLWLL